MKIQSIIAAISMFAVTTLAQVITKANQLEFRDYGTAKNITLHFGDFYLDGGVEGEGYGWVNSTKLISRFDGEIQRNLNVWGNLTVGGSKAFLHPHPTDSNKAIRYIAIESGEALTIARGTAKTVNGTAKIELPEHFSLVTSSEAPLTVLLTPKNAPAILYTTQESKNEITIALKAQDLVENGDVVFSWQVTGVRDGFENQQVIVGLDNNGQIEESAQPLGTEKPSLAENRAKIRSKSKAIGDKRMTYYNSKKPVSNKK